MKKQLKTFAQKSFKSISSLVMKYASGNVNYLCLAFLHQPKMPAGMDKYRKFK